jgi:hypothetical protein
MIQGRHLPHGVGICEIQLVVRLQAMLILVTDLAMTSQTGEGTPYYLAKSGDCSASVVKSTPSL